MLILPLPKDGKVFSSSYLLRTGLEVQLAVGEEVVVSLSKSSE